MMKQKKHHKSEAGQIIVIIAFLVIAMIAMLGLAIDAGGLFFLQRDSQNALDHAIIAATYARCSNGTLAQIEQAALDAAKEHGFEHGVDGVVVSVIPGPMTPPINGNDEYIQVTITAQKPSYFIQIVYSGALQVTTDGIGHCNPDIYSQHIQGISGLSPDCGTTVSPQAGGASNPPHSNHKGPYLTNTGPPAIPNGTHLFDTGIYSNDRINANGGTHLDTPGYTVEYVNTPSSTGSVPADGGSPTGEALNFPLLYDITDYAPGGDIWNFVPGGERFSYPNGHKLTHADLSSRGLHYIYGDVQIDNTPTMDGVVYEVTIVAEGYISFKSGPPLDRGFTSYTETIGTDYLVFFSTAGENVSNRCNVANATKFSGSSWPFSRGIIYLPYSVLQWTNAEAYFEGAFIAWVVDTGGAYFELHFKDYMIPPIPPTIGITK